MTRLARLLTATALISGTVGFAATARAQVVIGGDVQKPPIEIYNVNPTPFGEDGWPYNVKRNKKSWDADKPVDAAALPSRQVSPQLVQAARLEQSGLSKDEAKAAAASLSGGLQAPQIGGDKASAARDPNSTLPAVTTGQLMGETASSDPSVADSSQSLGTMPATETATAAAPESNRESLRVLDKPKNLADSLNAPAEAPVAEPTPVADAPVASSGKGRALFGKRGQKVATTETAAPVAVTPEASSDQVLHAPDNSDVAPTPQAMPSTPVDKLAAMPTPVPDTNAPDDTAATGEVASVTDLKAQPQLLGRVSEDSKGKPRVMLAANEPQKQADETSAPANNDEPKPAPAPDRHDAVAVLPSKAEEKSVAVLPQQPTGSSDGNDDHKDADVAAPAAAEPATEEAAKPAPRSLFHRMFGSDSSAAKTQEIHQEIPADNVPGPMEPERASIAPLAANDEAPAPVAEPITPVAEAQPATQEADAAAKPHKQPSFWDKLFGDDEEKPAGDPKAPGDGAAYDNATAGAAEPASNKEEAAPNFRVTTPPPAEPEKPAAPKLVPIAPAVSEMADHPITAGSAAAEIGFMPASQSVDSTGAAQLKDVADALQANPDASVTLNAYAKGKSPADAKRLSLHRALAVRSKLAELGIQPSRVNVNALGNSNPDSGTHSADRVDIIYH